MSKNVIIAQSGGPSPVINNSLRGVIEACRDFPDKFGKIYGAWHGIEGVLQEELLDISAQESLEISLLASTPGCGAIGTCRYKLKQNQKADFNRVVEIFKAHDIGFFFYIGGNDSMDTANKISRITRDQGLELTAVGIPKTIDNDVGDEEFKLIDHTPGYGSAARYWACSIQNANEENSGSCTFSPVLVLQIMGRKIGFLPAAARLADPRREMPLQIYLPEAGLTLPELAENVNAELKRSGRCIVAVSEGFDAGDIGPVCDTFGHVEYAASRSNAQQEVVNYLNGQKLAARGLVFGQLSGTDQRVTSLHMSPVDAEEAFQVGRHATLIAVKDGNGWMATILREEGGGYKARYDKAPLELIANSERRLPVAWIAPSRVDVTDDFVDYARPLIGEEWAKIPMEGGIQRFTHLKHFEKTSC